MKIKGIETLKYKIPYEIILPNNQRFTILLDPLPFDFAARLKKELPDEAKPPAIGALRDKSGRLVRDTDGRAIMEYNIFDKNYQTKQTEELVVWNCALIYLALENNLEIEFESKKENFEAYKDFYKAIKQELHDIGFNMKHINDIIALLCVDDKIKIIEDIKKNS